ncbi:hypothetical protein RJ639_012516 [Escallonia herrerae]|uniref:Uncharacterized protein n=1 Tax=Escallonia herrerae TaxID=1293975 RepID=A0AA88VPW4_9ASTE|nr:hypothetical protein RJ639_012516 [Escallonia herrerae]
MWRTAVVGGAAALQSWRQGRCKVACGPVLKQTYGDEEISISVMRLANIIPGVGDEDDGGVYQLFVQVDAAKPGQMNALHFLRKSVVNI